MNFVHENLEAFEGNERQQLVYAAYTMPAQVAKKLIGHPAVTEFRKFSETVEASRDLRKQWDEDLDNRQNLLKGLSENMKYAHFGVQLCRSGQDHGFQNMKD